MKIKKIMNENDTTRLNMNQLLKIRNDYFKKFNIEFENFVREFGEKDPKVIPVIKAMQTLETEYEKFLKNKGLL